MTRLAFSEADPAIFEVFTKVSDSKLRDEYNDKVGVFIGESRKVIERACNAGIMPHSMFIADKWLDDCTHLLDLLEANDPKVPIVISTEEEFKKVTGYRVTRGPVAAFYRPKPLALEDLCKDAKRIAVLENINNYTNVGAIFRSAAALGIDGILVTSTTHDPLYRRAARVSMGTVFQVPWCRVNDETWPSELAKLGFKTVALALIEDSIPIDSPILKEQEKLAIVLGSEGDGLAASTISACDFTSIIPMKNGVDSLNVAAASALAFWELRV